MPETDSPDEARPPDARTAAEITRLRSEGAFGESGRLRDLFEFLAARSGDMRPPKEAEIALAVFGKSAEANGGGDAVARVYVHRLRKRLDVVYARAPSPTGARLEIPNGEYRLTLRPPDAPMDAQAGVEPGDGRSSARPRSALSAAVRQRTNGRLNPRALWLAAACGLAALNLAGWAIFARPDPRTPNALADSAIGRLLAPADRPLLVVVGDYYIFGEYEDRLFLKRLIRDFAINSKSDLLGRYLNDPEARERYGDVALQYLPTSTANALLELAPLLAAAPRREVMLASELTPDRLKGADILYVGLLSGLGSLKDVVFAASRFSIGESYDDLLDRSTGVRYRSEAFLAAPGDGMYRDYGYFATFRGPAGGRISIVAGARDTGVMGLAEALSERSSLQALGEAGEDADGFEALLEVRGQKHVNLETRIVSSGVLDSEALWRGPDAPPLSFPSE